MVLRERKELEKRQLSYFWSIFKRNSKLRFTKLLIGFCFIIRARDERKKYLRIWGNIMQLQLLNKKKQNWKQNEWILKQQLSREKKKSFSREWQQFAHQSSVAFYNSFAFRRERNWMAKWRVIKGNCLFCDSIKNSAKSPTFFLKLQLECAQTHNFADCLANRRTIMQNECEMFFCSSLTL